MLLTSAKLFEGFPFVGITRTKLFSTGKISGGVELFLACLVAHE